MRDPSRVRHAAARLFRHESRGQSLTEFALFLPVLLLLVLVALDFGRVYLGWVNLQQMARVGANFAADHALTWPADRDRYRAMLENEASLINCDLPDPLPDPAYGADISLGRLVSVKFDCEFTLVTPVISQILGTSITASASATFPIKDGIVGNIPGGGGPVTPAPEADFSGTPLSGWSPLTVTFTDETTNAPGTWAWDFNDGTPTGTNPTASPGTASSQGPHTVTFTCGGAPGETCIFDISLDVSNSGGSDSHAENDYVSVTVPPNSGPIAEFTGTPQTGTQPLTVDFQFVETTTGVTYTDWSWDFGDGTALGSGANPTHVYRDEGDYDVELTVTDDTGATNTLRKSLYISVAQRVCTVPDFQNKWRFPHNSGDPGAQAIWAAAGFTTTVLPNPDTQGGRGNANYKIKTQTLTGGTIDPQPDGCDSTISVGP